MSVPHAVLRNLGESRGTVSVYDACHGFAGIRWVGGGADPDAFEDFRRIVYRSGARFVKAERHSELELDTLANLTRALVAAGFRVEVDEVAARAVAEFEAEEKRQKERYGV